MTDDKKEFDPLLMRRPTPAHYIIMQDEASDAANELAKQALPLDADDLAEKSIAAEELYAEFTELISAYVQSSDRGKENRR